MFIGEEVIFYGIFKQIGRKNLGEEAQGYYREGLEMSDERLMEKLERAKRYKRFAELAGYNKAAKERGLV